MFALALVHVDWLKYHAFLQRGVEHGQVTGGKLMCGCCGHRQGMRPQLGNQQPEQGQWQDMTLESTLVK